MAVFLFEDKFTTDRAAGAVNGTACEVGPGNRTVVDTASGLSLASGIMTAVGKSTLGDPLLKVPAITRTVGLLAFFRVSVPNVTQQVVWGFFSDAAGTVKDDCMSVLSSKICGYSNDLVQPGVFTPVNATYYPCVMALRASGAFLFIYTGGLWKLFWRNSWGTAATLYPGFTANDGTINADYIRFMNYQYLPAPLASDGFSGTLAVTDGYGHTEGVTGGLGAGGANVTWCDQGTWSISGSKLYNTPTLGTEVCSDPGLEATYTSGKCDTLTKGGTPTLAESADVHGGSKAQSFVADAQLENVRLAMTGLTAGTWYSMSQWSKRSAGTKGGVALLTNINGTTMGPRITDANYTQKFF